MEKGDGPMSSHPGPIGSLPALHGLWFQTTHARGTYVVCALSDLNETANVVVRYWAYGPGVEIGVGSGLGSGSSFVGTVVPYG